MKYFNQKKKKKIFCDIFGQKALKIAVKNKVHGVKIHSSDLEIWN